MSKFLTRIRRAQIGRRSAYHDYHAAVLAAREAGHTVDEIAQAAGIGRTGVYYLLNPDPRKEQKT
jgi:AcrR family transcriptional regulator